MGTDGLLSISEMAKFTRVSRTALIYYDKMGLVSPVARGENDYRYYSEHQIDTVNLINTLKDMGIPLKDIAKIAQKRTPKKILKLFDNMDSMIDNDIMRLMETRTLMHTLKAQIEGALSVNEDEIKVRWCEEESIFLGPQNDYSNGRILDEALFDFYMYCTNCNENMNLNYSVWGRFTEERIRRRDWKWPNQFYFSMPDAPDRKPAGLYLVGYDRGYYGETDALYNKLLIYIAEHDLEICGPTYEEYPLNEISVVDPEHYLIRVSISVRER